MVAKERFLVVVSVLEGRRFPKRPRHKLIAEARFDGELLATDPIQHNEAPDFQQEIAWSLDKKGLYQHRLQRSAIKVQLYAVDPLSTMREAIGYVMLDLRSAQNNIQTSKWYPLLHGKYSRSKPEVRLGIYIDDDTPQEVDAFKAKDAPARIGLPPVKAAPPVDPALLKPHLADDGAYYQIGPSENCDKFVLSVTIAFAANLPQLIPSSEPLPDTGQGYFFYYSLIGNDITNTAFSDLISPNFPAERASTAIISSVDVLRAFFDRQSGIQIHLCCGEHSLGSCEVPLKDLLKPGSTDIYMNQVTVEGVFNLEPPTRVKALLPPYASDTAPSVGVAVTLRMEKPEQKPTMESTPLPASPPKREGASSPVRQTQAPSTSRARDRDEETSELLNTENGVSNLPKDQDRKDSKKPSQSPKKKSPSRARQPEVHHDTATATSSTQPRYAAPASVHHYNFSLDLRTLRNVETSSALNIYARYTYPFFGSAAPVRTYPSVEITRGTEVTLPQSYCAFDFGTNYQQLEETFRNSPLRVELWDRDKHKDTDTLFGMVHVPLHQLLLSDRIPVHGGNQGWRQMYGNSLVVQHPTRPSVQVGEMVVQMTLDDLGPVHEQQVHLPSTETEPVAPPAEPRENGNYNAALELEMWKEVQESLFENKLKEKESVHMRALADEWKRRDRERELLVKKKVAEYSQLEEQLKKTMSDFEKKQKQLSNNESDVQRLKKDLEREHERKMQEMREASRRMKEECEHMVELERMKVTDLKDQIGRYKSLLDESDRKYQSLDREFAAYREKQNCKPEVRLQSEINLLTLEKVELERKVDSVTKSKVHYKQQWGRALKELARLKQKEQESARQQLKVQQTELEHMRLRYLAAEEKEVVKTEMKELDEIKNEINRLKEQELSSKKMSPEKEGGLYSLRADLDSSFDDHIARLIEERDALLKTGVYSNNDVIIGDLDKQIREAIAGKGS